MGQKPNLKDVARAAGVHVSTVSRALNPATAKLLSVPVAQRIRAIAAEMGYCPNAMAAALRTARSGAVGFVVPDLTHPSFPHMLRGIGQALDSTGYVVLAMSVEHDFRRAPALLQELRSRRVDGLIVATAQVDDPFIAAALAEKVPMVAINAADGEEGRFSSVMADERVGFAAAMTHLRILGHRRIGHLGGPALTRTGNDRMEAFLAHGGVPDRVERCETYDRAAARDPCRRLLDRFPPGSPQGLTAIAAANDLLALGCLDVLAERGLSCPGDVSLTGFLDLPHMDLIAPALTTVRIDQQAIGQQAAQLLLERMDSPDAPAETVILPATLVARASCRRI